MNSDCVDRVGREAGYMSAVAGSRNIWEGGEEEEEEEREREGGEDRSMAGE
jgi:hypothetical protein